MLGALVLAAAIIGVGGPGPGGGGAGGPAGAAAESLGGAADTAWYSIRIHAVRVSDTCGGGARAAGITPEQVSLWVARANIVYAAARVRFEFDPTPRTGDRSEIADTDVNNLVGEIPGDPLWERASRTGNDFAARYLDKLVVFFRNGPDAGPTGGGFGGTRYRFVVMPGFDVTRICGRQNIDLLAHEMGHYFGLAHTFRPFKTTVEAQAALRAMGNRPDALDGDKLEDTPPEPYIESMQCGDDPMIILNGIPFPLLRSNIMSYYASDTKTLTPDQVKVVRSGARSRFPATLTGRGLLVPDERRTYRIASAENGLVFDAGATGDGRVGAVKATGAASQTWRFVPLLGADEGLVQIVSVSSGRCLAIENSAMSDGARLVLVPWTGAGEQKWRLTRDEQGVSIQARHSRKALALPRGLLTGASRRTAPPGTEGVAQVAWDPANASQRWRIEPTADR